MARLRGAGVGLEWFAAVPGTQTPVAFVVSDAAGGVGQPLHVRIRDGRVQVIAPVGCELLGERRVGTPKRLASLLSQRPTQNLRVSRLASSRISVTS